VTEISGIPAYNSSQVLVLKEEFLVDQPCYIRQQTSPMIAVFHAKFHHRSFLIFKLFEYFDRSASESHRGGYRAGKRNWFQEREGVRHTSGSSASLANPGSRPRPTVRDHNSSLLSAICSLNCDPSKLINIRPNSSQSISLPSITRSGTRPPRSSAHSIRPRTTP